MTRSSTLVSLVLLVLAAGGPCCGVKAAEESCVAPQQAQVAVKLRHDVPLVQVGIDGKPATLVLDTGAQETVLTTAAATRLGLAGHYEYPRRIGALGGSIASGVATTRSFTTGALDVPGFQVIIGSVALPDIEGIQPDGLLGADFLADFATDLNVPDGRLTLYRRQCVGAEPAWRPPYTTIAANRSLHDHLFFPVTLDGHPLYAFIDSGAQRSMVDRDAALALGVTAAELARGAATTLRGATAQDVAAQLHRFARLQIGDIVIRDPVLGVTPLGRSDADIILGEDFIEPRRLWLSYEPPGVFVKNP
jgi:predicted aspartyl protease